MSDGGPGSKAIGLLLTLLAGFVGGLLLHEPFARFTCGLMSPGIAAGVQFYCSDEYRPVSIEDATREIDTFLARASGTRPLSAWSELGPDAQGERTSDRFLEGWGDVYWAERMGEVEADPGFNYFTVHYRVFRGTGPAVISPRVDTRDRGFQVKYHEGITQITDLQPLANRRIVVVSIPQVITMQGATSHSLPTSSEEAGVSLRAGRSLPILCRIELPDGWWGRYPHGWLRGDDITGGEGALARASTCDPHHREAALALSGG